MSPTPHQILAAAPLLAACAALWLAGCRGQGPEAGLDPALFERPGASLTSDARGQWFVVVPEAQRSLPLAVITYKEDRKLFFALPRGRRAMELLPLSPVPQSWFAAAQDCGCAQVTMTDDPQGMRLSDQIGVADGAGRVTWLGPAPRAAVQAVFMPPRMGNALVPLRTLLIGAGYVTADGKLGGAAVPAGSLVIGDGDVRAEADIRVVALADDAPNLALGDTVKVTNLPADKLSFEPFEPRYARTGQVLGRRVGADVLLTRRDGAGWRVQLVEPNTTQLTSAAQLAPSISEVPLSLATPDLARVMRGVLAVRRGHPLTAYTELDPALLAVEGGTQAALLRVEELLGAAHWTQWMRVARMDGQTHLQGPDFFYLARAMLLERGLQSSDRLSKNALASFGYWPDPAGSLGVARSWALLAEIARRRGQTSDALIAAQEAARLYVVAGDVLRAADLELFAAQLSLQLGKPDDAMRLVEMARSRYFHGHFVYGCALAELAMAELHMAAGRSDEATKLAGYALKRMIALNEPIGINRAKIVAALVDLSRGQDRQRELEEGLSRALSLRDPEGAARAAAALVNLRQPDPDRVWPLGQAILDGLPSVQQQLASAQVLRALSTLCAQGLPQSAAAAQADALQLRGVQIACQDLSGGALVDGTGRSWLDDGYRSVQLRDDAMARLRASQLSDLLTDSFTARTPQRAAEIWLYRAVVAAAIDADPAASDAAVEQALATLSKHLDPVLVTVELAQSAALMVERGQPALAQRLYQRALAQLVEQRKYAEAIDAALRLLDVQLLSDDPAAMAATLRTADALVPADPRGDALRVRLLHYRAAIAPEADRAALRAEIASRTAQLPPEARISLGIADAALLRRQERLQEASAALSAVEATSAQLPDELLTSLPIRRQLAAARIALAEIAAHAGRYADAAATASQAERQLSEDPSPEAALARIDALRLLVQLAVTGKLASDARAELLILASQPATPAARPVVAHAWRALTALAIEADDAAAAQAARLRVQQLGLTSALATTDAACQTASIEQGPRAQAALAACAAGAGESARSARISAALAGQGGPAALAALDALTLKDGPRWSARQRARVALLIESARGKRANNDAEARRLRDALAKAPAGDPALRTRAADALISYLLDVGQPQQARAIVEQERASLMQAGEESATLLACSEVLLGVAELAPLTPQTLAALDALNAYAPTSPALFSRARRARARHYIAVGQLGRARLELTAALDAARLATDAAAERELSSLIAQLYHSP